MRARLALSCVLVVAAFGCGPDNPAPALAIVPSGPGPVAITAPTVFSAVLTNLTGDVTWAVTGAGKLSATSGLHVTYAPPPGSATETITASAGQVTTTVQVMSGPQVMTGKTIPGLTAPVTVAYDAQDIPHIKCAATADCLAVQGYLQARDRLFPMDFLRHVARGTLAELIGEAGLAQDIQIHTLFITRAGHRLEDDLAAALDAPTAALLTAYAGGVNAFLAALRAGTDGVMPGEYAQLPFPITPADVPDWSIKDTLALARLQQFQLSEGIEEESTNGLLAQAFTSQGDPHKITAYIRAAAPTTEQAHTLSATASHVAARIPAATTRPRVNLTPWKDVLRATSADARRLREGLRALGDAVGSNNWVVGAGKSATGKAMVANDPHLTLQYPPLFHLSVMTSTKASDNLDLAGGAFPGIPGALVGRGAHVGWGVTVVGYDVTDLYLEQFPATATCPSAPAPCVQFKGAKASTIPVPQVYNVRVGPGAAGVVPATVPDENKFVLVVPHHGPIIKANRASDGSGTGVSARWTGQEGNTADVKAIFGLNTAVNVDAAIEALKGFSTGAQNFVLADDAGHIAYDPHALVPVRKFTETGAPIPPWFPVPGDGTAEWGDGVHDCAAATATPVDPACWIADAALPQGKDPAKGYFFTANADPTANGVSDDNNPLAHPPYLSYSWDDSSGFRATRIEQRLNALASAGTISLADMESIQADHVSRPGMAFGPIIAALPPASGPAELALAQAVIAQWGTNGWDCPTGLTGTDPKNSAVDTTAKTQQLSQGCFLFHVFLRALATNVFADDLAVAKQGVNGLAAVKAMLYMLAPGTPDADKAFCNNVDPTTGALVAAHTCAEQVGIALVQAYKTLVAQVGPPASWVWGKVHTIQPVSLLALVTTNYQPGPYARPGGAFTVDVGNPSLTAAGLSFGYASGGNVRHISVMDPAKPVVRMQLPGPERDGPDFTGGPDLLGQWVANKYFDYAFSAQIDGAAVATQTFKAP
jgi:penicillin G amidase